MKEHLAKSYETGKATADRTINEIVYGELAPSWMFDDFASYQFFEAGRQGHPIPAYRTGWRYGDIPVSGQSRNYREEKAEAGVSVMQLDGDDKVKTLSELRSLTSRPVILVGGYVNPLEVGGDGEPLLLDAERI